MKTHVVPRYGYILSSGWATFLTALVLASPLIYWGLDRREPVVVRQITLWPSEVRPGDKISRVITVFRRKTCETDVDVVIIDGARVRWVVDEPAVAHPGPVGVEDTYKAPLVIPVLATPGEAEMRIVAKRKCNPLHAFWPIITVYEPIKFTIHPGAS